MTAGCGAYRAAILPVCHPQNRLGSGLNPTQYPPWLQFYTRNDGDHEGAVFSMKGLQDRNALAGNRDWSANGHACLPIGRARSPRPWSAAGRGIIMGAPKNDEANPIRGRPRNHILLRQMRFADGASDRQAVARKPIRSQFWGRRPPPSAAAERGTRYPQQAMGHPEEWAGTVFAADGDVRLRTEFPPQGAGTRE